MRGGSWLNTTFVFFLFFFVFCLSHSPVSERKRERAAPFALAVMAIILEEQSAYLPGNVIIPNAKTVWIQLIRFYYTR